MDEKLKELSEKIGAAIADQMAKPEYQAIIKEAKKGDTGTFEVIITTEDVDRMGEVVLVEGWELTRYMLNPIVLFGHDYHTLPVGVTESIEQVEINGVKGLKAKGYFAGHEMAQDIRAMYDAKIMRATSVGFIPKKYAENDYDTIIAAELLEWSFVGVPANPYALSTLGAEKVADLTAKGLLQEEVKEGEPVDNTEDVPAEPETDQPEEKEEETVETPAEEDNAPEEPAEEPEAPAEEEKTEEKPEEEEVNPDDVDPEKGIVSEILVQKNDKGNYLILKTNDGVAKFEADPEVIKHVGLAISVLKSTSAALEQFGVAISALEGLKKDLEGKEDTPEEEETPPEENDETAEAKQFSQRVKEVQELATFVSDWLGRNKKSR